MIFHIKHLKLEIEDVSDIEELVEAGIISDQQYEQARRMLLDQMCNVKGDEDGAGGSKTQRQ